MGTTTDPDALGRRLDKLRFWRRACSESAEAAVVYNADRADPPLFFFHGDYDYGGLYVRRLATRSGHKLVSLAPQGVRGDPVPTTIEAMAAARLSDIKAVRPRGPYRLGGYCNGALVAYEAARLLAADGDAVEVVVLLEPSSLNVRPIWRALHDAFGFAVRLVAPAPRREALVGEAMRHAWSVGRVLRMSPRELAALARHVARRAVTRRLRERRAGEHERALHTRAAALTRAYYRASAAHVPSPADFRVVALSTGRDGAGRRSSLYDAVAWERVCADFRHMRLPGHHATCLSEGVDALAEHLAAILVAPVPAEPEPLPSPRAIAFAGSGAPS